MANAAMSECDGDRVFELAAELFGLLSAPVRLHIVCELLEGEQSAGGLAERVGASAPNLSQHLATLYRGGILARRRVGSQVWYRLASRRAAMQAKGAQAWKPESRERVVSYALKAYAMLATSADKGAVRDRSKLEE